MTQGDGGGDDTVDCENYPQYCNGNVPKTGDELRDMRKKKGDASDATIRIGFGTVDGEGNFNGHAGLGTVVGDSHTIVTAWHVFAGSGPNLYYRDKNGELHGFDLSTVTINRLPGGDVIVITLPDDLPEDFVPAQLISSPHLFVPFQNVSVPYRDSSNQLHVLETKLDAFPLTLSWADYSINLSLNNPNRILNEGDSGGGVFYDGYLVGVTSDTFPQFGTQHMAFDPLGYSLLDSIFK